VEDHSVGDPGKAASSEVVPQEGDTGEAPQQSLGIHEQRRHPRYRCEGRAEVLLPHGGMLIRGRILNLSVSGCFIEAPTITLERGTHVEVFFESKQLQFRVAGSIAILHPRSGVGILFMHVSFRVATQLQSLIAELAEAS
jgi:hypothetical protein